MINNTKQVILVTGAACSGKSEWAESLAQNSHKSVVYVATAMVNDDDQEWQAKILKHQQRRPSNWLTITETTNLTEVINQAQPEQCFLIDSIGTWVANLLELDEDNWAKISDNLLSNVIQVNSQFIFVAEETGWGVVPAYTSGRIFRNRLGTLTRQIGMMADTTYLVTGGHVLNLTVLGKPLNI